MATLKLNKPKAGAPASSPRAPVRGANAPRTRPTLAQAQAEREARAQREPRERDEREAARDERRAPRDARDRSDARTARRPDAPRSAPTPARAGPSSKPRPTGPAPRPAPRAEADEPLRPRLSKRLSELGLASRREADEWIAAGLVTVDGVVVNELGSRVGLEQKIEIDPRAREQQAKRATVLLNKPIGYVSGQPEDGHESAAVLIRAENHWSGDASALRPPRAPLPHLAPAGRLDIDSTGLLVLTQDGRVAKQLIGADSTTEKEYLVRVTWPARPDVSDLMSAFPPEQIERLRHGLELDGRQLQRAQVSWQNEQQLRFVLREGRKRQIRRMCELVGLKVVGLKRVRIGRIALGKLPLGQWRYLAAWESF
ncbi:pseudouridine synthase [Caldimonas sp. KR1-144]|uniref:pseudouridine synthase n=1 Tax=Caldimonas sp. KR1-144 TaxID=3400911 RepID=UPI003BFFBD8C